MAEQIFLGTIFGKVIWEANILGINFASKISFWEEKNTREDKYLGEEKIWGANFRENKMFWEEKFCEQNLGSIILG